MASDHVDLHGASIAHDRTPSVVPALAAAGNNLAGRVFVTKKEAILAIKNVALQSNHRIRCHDKLRGRTFTVYQCDRTGCSCRIEVSQVRRRDMEGFRISKVAGIDRMCVSDVAQPTQTQVARLLHVRAAVVQNKRISAAALQAIALQAKGWRIHPTMALRARDQVVHELQASSYIDRFRQLHGLLAAFEELDHDTVVAVAGTLYAHALDGRPVAETTPPYDV